MATKTKTKINITKRKLYGVYLFKTIASVVAIIFIFLIIAFWYKGKYKEKIYPGIYFQQQNLEGTTYIEFMNLFQPYFPDNKINLIAKETFISFDVPLVERKKLLDVIWKKIHNKGRESVFSQRLKGFLQRMFRPDIFLLEDTSLDTIVSEEFFTSFKINLNLDSVFDGSIEVGSNDIIVKEYPQDGEYVDFELLKKEIFAKIIFGGDSSITILINERDALRDKSDIDDIAENISTVVKRTIIARHPRDERVVEIETKDIISLVSFTLSDISPNSFNIVVDEEKFNMLLNKFEPQNALVQLETDGSISIIPSQSGIMADIPRTVNSFKKTLLNTQRSDFVVTPDAFIRAEITTEDLQELGMSHVISEFTTFHDCCSSRVENIHLVADKLDGVIINPGEVLSLNKFLGERKSEDGFKSAGAIFEGELVDSVGGGISQFITTLHNAVFWGGYEIISHKAHSIYFPRYPVGVEATINWPYLDYVFKNNTIFGVMLDTEYTDTSITVRFLGFNHGRVLEGEHKEGITNINVIHEGEIQSRKVYSEVSDPYNLKPPTVRYISDERVSRGESYIQQRGNKGWSVNVSREIRVQDIIESTEYYIVPYRAAKDTFIRINICDNPQEKNKPGYCYSR
jgi:vancomycin resistance protein YoaR